MIWSRLSVEGCWNTTSKFQYYDSAGFFMPVVVFTWKSGVFQRLNGNANDTALGNRVLLQS